MANSESLLAQPVVEAWQTHAATKALSYYALMQLVSAVKPIPCPHNHLLLLLCKAANSSEWLVARVGMVQNASSGRRQEEICWQKRQRCTDSVGLRANLFLNKNAFAKTQQSMCESTASHSEQTNCKQWFACVHTARKGNFAAAWNQLLRRNAHSYEAMIYSEVCTFAPQLNFFDSHRGVSMFLKLQLALH